MNKFSRMVLTAFAVLLAGACIAYSFGAPRIGSYLIALPLVLSGWAALGHLVTLDDEMKGGWSNPEGSRAIWHKSLGELAIKFTVFGLVLLLFFAQHEKPA